MFKDECFYLHCVCFRPTILTELLDLLTELFGPTILIELLDLSTELFATKDLFNEVFGKEDPSQIDEAPCSCGLGLPVKN